MTMKRLADRNGREVSPELLEMLTMWVRENPGMAAATLIDRCSIKEIVLAERAADGQHDPSTA